MRVFLGFCVDRNWSKENPAKKIKLPRNIKPNEVVPFTSAEVDGDPESLRHVSENRNTNGCARGR